MKRKNYVLTEAINLGDDKLVKAGTIVQLIRPSYLSREMKKDLYLDRPGWDLTEMATPDGKYVISTPLGFFLVPTKNVREVD